MDPQRFTDSKTGELRKFSRPETEKVDWLFLPHDLPPRWDFPDRLWPLLAEAREALGTLNGSGQVLPNPYLLLNPLQNREAISSSSIEGTYVTPRQLLLYQLDPQEPESAEGAVADSKEVANYRAALSLGCELMQDGPILNRHLKEMHGVLMRGVRGSKKTPGDFRAIQVQIGAAGKYIPPPPSEVSSMMANLERYVNEPSKELDAVVRCFIVHYQFEAIHPFSDGNGRIGRVLLALMICKHLGHSDPWLYMSEFFEEHREEYTDLMFRVSTHGDWSAWVEFCLVGATTQARRANSRCNKLRRLRDAYESRIESSSTPRSHTIIKWLFEFPVVTVPATASLCGVSYKTAQTDLERLVSVGVLEEIPSSYPRAFAAHELLQVAYESGPTGDEGA